MKKNIKKILCIIISILVIFGIAIYLYTKDYYKADLTAKEATKSTSEVSVKEEDNYYIFSSKTKSNNIGYIFYPGAKVEEIAYAPLMYQLASNGITCYILKMPLHLAVLAPNSANYVLSKNSNISSWYIGGHSLGGVIATNYALNNVKKFKGIILMASYPNVDLSKTNLKMLSFYGNNDLVLNIKSFNTNKKYAPKETTYYEIKGGNHAYYGNYGEQKKDGKATITNSEQQNVVVLKILNWLNI